jgi:predicted ATP-dependent endonuclease of OLD family
MKISKLHIDQFRHLENLDIDFTYQSGDRKGQTLDKICFIGQSATGKTSLLELIKEQHKGINNAIISGNNFSYKSEIEIIKACVSFNLNDTTIKINNNKLNYDNKTFNFVKSGNFSNLLNEEQKENLYYFKANLISDFNISFLSTNPIELIEKYSSKIENLKISKRNNRLSDKEIIFNDNIDESIFLLLLIDYLEYRKKFTQKMSELIHKGFIHDVNKLSKEFNKWQKDNPNRLELFAKEFNYILERLNLEVDLVNTEYSVPIKNKRIDEIIPFQDTSTGTKQLLLTSLPLYSLETKDSIILIDEPERSLYPNIQMEIMEYYKKLAPQSQFIVATHSPFIAASFEPEERFILYFDEAGKVAVRRGISPIGDDPNDMLFNDFGVNYYNEDVQGKFKEYIELLDKVKSEDNKELKKKYILEASKLGNLYNFILDEKNQERLQ